MRILIVEDDKELQGRLQQILERHDFQVNLAEDGIEALYYAEEYDIDLAIVDLGLPKMDGLDLIRRLRQGKQEFPIFVLTARSGWQAKVQGLDAGADDYLTKPFQPEELLARINALLRRSNGRTSTLIEHGPIALDTAINVIRLHGEELDLTAFEHKVLEHFLRNPGKIITRTMLIDRLYDQQQDKDSNVVEVIIARLRKKLGGTDQYRPIETLRGRGYRLMNGKP